MAGMSESPEELVPQNPAIDAGKLPPHRTGCAPEGKHMTVAGARDAGQRVESNHQHTESHKWFATAFILPDSDPGLANMNPGHNFRVGV